MPQRVLSWMLAAVLTTALGSGQTPAAMKFDVSTVKPNLDVDKFRIGMQIAPDGRFSATGVTLKLLVQEAYDLRDFQISGGPAWISSDRWDLEAKSDTATAMTHEQVRQMLKLLLADRFQLKAHEDVKDTPIYELSVAKGGLKMKPSQVLGQGGGQEGGMMRMGRGKMSANGVALPQLAQMLGQQSGRPVIDKTGLTGTYDLSLQWTPELGQGGGPLGLPAKEAAAQVGGEGPTIFTAVEEQLGLKLNSARGPVSMVVIDQVEKPSEN